VQNDEPGNDFAARAKAAWAQLIRNVYEADPLVLSIRYRRPDRCT
jgi:hypothetical protein